MKKLIYPAVIVLFLASLALAASSEKEVYVPFNYVDPQVQYVPNAFVIDLKPEADRLKAPSVTAVGTFGIAELDGLGSQFGVTNVMREFPGAKPEPLGSTIPDLTRYYIVDFSESFALADVISAFGNNPLVDHVEPIGIHPIEFIPNDTYFSPGQAFGYQNNMHNAGTDRDIDAPEAWDIQKGSTSIAVGDLDTGLRYYHRDLGGNSWTGGPSATGTTGNIWVNNADPVDGVDNDGNGFVDDHIGWDFVTGITGCASGEDCSTPDNDPADFNGHGTHVGGIMSAITNNARGVAGVGGGDAGGSQTGIGNGVKIMALRIGWSDPVGNGFVNMAFAAQAIDYARQKGAVAINCSWGSSNSGGIAAALDAFEAAGGLVCKAAGNSNNSTADYINSRPNTMSVAATDSNDVKASFSSFGTWVDVSAPGVDIISTYHVNTDPVNDYVAKLSGTSMSTPHVTGLAGLLKSQDPSLTRTQLYDLIKNNTDNIDGLNPSYVGLLGTGRINARNSLNAITPPCNVVANFSGTPTSGCSPLTVNFSDLSTGPVTSWSWNFGDGGTSTLQNPSHSYASAGSYTVTLTVSSATCSDPETKTNYITVSTAPTAQFVGSPTSGPAPLTVNFTDQSTGGPTSWSWDFGDAGTSTLQNPSHIYTIAGTYTVTLTASNPCGSDGETKVNYIIVTAPPAQQCDDFNDGNLNGWGNSLGTWTATGGLMNGNSNTNNARITSPFGSFSTPTIDCDVRMNTGRNQRKSRIVFAYVDGSNYRFVEGDDVNNWWRIYERTGGSNIVRLTINQTINTSQWYHVNVAAASNGNVTMSVDGVTLGSYLFPSAVSGLVGCGFNRSNSDFDNFCVGSQVLAASIIEPGLEVAESQTVPIPENFRLGQNYPNPFNLSTTISFSIPERGMVSLTIYNIKGQKVKTLVDGIREPGVYNVYWNGTNDKGDIVASGIYLYRLSANGKVATAKMSLLK